MFRRTLLLTLMLAVCQAFGQTVGPQPGRTDGEPAKNPPRAGTIAGSTNRGREQGRGSCPAPLVVASGGRFLDVVPQPPDSTVPVALFVTSATYPFFCAYVDAGGRLTLSPVFRAPVEWGTVHLTDDGIVPNAMYSVQADCGAGIISATASDTTWLWGDVNNDGIVELADILCELDGYRGNFSQCSFQALNLAAPDNLIDLPDLLAVLVAYGGAPYPDPTPTSSLSVDPVPAITAALSIPLTGRAPPDAVSIEIVGELNTVTAAVEPCGWSAKVPLGTNFMNRLVVTAILKDGTSSAPVFVEITQDSRAPTVFIDFPAANSQITSPVTNVAGRVSDMLSGFSGLAVTVNGQPAAVSIGIGTNGTFFVPKFALAVGPNVLTAVATDAVGNTIQHQISVARIEIPPGAPTLQVVSGDAQSAAIHQVLAEPITVQVRGASGKPLQGKVVNFKVTRSDGRLSATAPPFFGIGSMQVQALTDVDGRASAFWRLGGDAGSGNNRVEVTSADVVGTTDFCATAMHGPAAQINIGTGNNQRGVVGGRVPEPLRIWVSDSCNPVLGVPVTFFVAGGGGRVNGQTAVTLTTGPTGHAEVEFDTGPEPGLNIVDVDFVDNRSAAARFFIYGLEADPAQPTRFSGIVLDNGHQPLQGAMCALIVGAARLMAQSDLNGRFEFSDIPEDGPAEFLVNGATVFHLGGAAGLDVLPETYPFLHYELQIVAHADNSLPMPVLLPALNLNNARLFDNTQNVELTVEGIEGLRMVIKAGSMMLADGRIPAPHSPVRVSLNQVHFDDVPMPMTDGAAPPFAWTLQPGGARFDPPVSITYPNMSGLPAGAATNFLSFNHDTGRFEIAASGRVSDDGRFILSDPGSGISVAGWGCNCPPYSVTGECCHAGSGRGGLGCCVVPCPPCQEGCAPDCTPIICVGECQVCEDSECVPTSGGPCGDQCGLCFLGECVDMQACGACQTCQGGICVPCGQCETCVNGVCISTGTECGQGCCPASTTCCIVTGQGPTCLPAGSTCCDQFGAGLNVGVCQPPSSTCCPGGCAPDGSTCCPEGNSACATLAQCCGSGPCCASGEVCCDGHCYAPGSECCEGTTCQNEFGEIWCCDGAEVPLCGCSEGECGSEPIDCCGGGLACGGLIQCCGSDCIDSALACCNGMPCPPGQACCGNNCTPPGQQCCHTGSAPHLCDIGRCCGADCCPEGAVCCDGECYAGGTVCCPQGGSCPASLPQCCNDTCIPASSTCCPSGGACPSSTPVCCGPPGGPTSICCSADLTCCVGPAGQDCCSSGQTCNAGVCQ